MLYQAVVVLVLRIDLMVSKTRKNGVLDRVSREEKAPTANPDNALIFLVLFDFRPFLESLQNPK